MCYRTLDGNHHNETHSFIVLNRSSRSRQVASRHIIVLHRGVYNTKNMICDSHTSLTGLASANPLTSAIADMNGASASRLRLLHLQVIVVTIVLLTAPITHHDKCHQPLSHADYHRTPVPLGFSYVTAVALSYFVLGTPSGSTYALTVRMLFSWACNQHPEGWPHYTDCSVCSVLSYSFI